MVNTLPLSSIRRELGQSDGLICRYCLTQLTLETVTLDHIVPKSWINLAKPYCNDFYINPNNINNLILACEKCNRRKNNSMYGHRFYPPFRMFRTGVLYHYIQRNMIHPHFLHAWINRPSQRQIRLPKYLLPYDTGYHESLTTLQPLTSDQDLAFSHIVLSDLAAQLKGLTVPHLTPEHLIEKYRR